MNGYQQGFRFVASFNPRDKKVLRNRHKPYENRYPVLAFIEKTYSSIKNMNKQTKSIIMGGVVGGVVYASMMAGFDYSDGQDFKIWKFIFHTSFFGIFMGIGFPYITQKFGSKFISKIGKNIKPELTENENIEIEGPANLFRGLEGVGGKLFITNKKLIFNSHKINIQKGQTDIPFENISEIIKRKTAKLIDNGIRIKTNDGNEFNFVVNEREQWIEKLNQKIK